MATKVVKGNFFQGYLGKQSDDKKVKESVRRACMYRIARITPEANALTTADKSLSGISAGIIRENNGKHAPTMLATKIEKTAMIISGNTFALSWRPPL